MKLLSLLALLLTCTAGSAQSPNAVLSQLGANGVTELGGTTNYAHFIPRLGPTGKLAASMLPDTSAGTSIALNRLVVVDAVNGLDSTNRTGTLISPYATLAYAVTRTLPGKPVFLFAPGSYPSTVLDVIAHPALTNATLMSLVPGAATLASLTYSTAGGTDDVYVYLQGLRIAGTLAQQDQRYFLITANNQSYVDSVSVATAPGYIYRDASSYCGIGSTGTSYIVRVLTTTSQAIGYDGITVFDALRELYSNATATAGAVGTNFVTRYSYPLAGNPSNFLVAANLPTNQLTTNDIIRYSYPLGGNPSNFLVAANLPTNQLTTNDIIRYSYPLSGNPSNYVTPLQLSAWTNGGGSSIAFDGYAQVTYLDGTCTVTEITVPAVTVTGTYWWLDGYYANLGGMLFHETNYDQQGVLSFDAPWSLYDQGTLAYTGNVPGAIMGIADYSTTGTVTVLYTTNTVRVMTYGDGLSSIIYSNPSVFYPASNPNQYIPASVTNQFYPSSNPSNFITTVDTTWYGMTDTWNTVTGKLDRSKGLTNAYTLYGTTNLAYTSNNAVYVKFATNTTVNPATVNLTNAAALYGSNAAFASNNTVYVRFYTAYATDAVNQILSSANVYSKTQMFNAFSLAYRIDYQTNLVWATNLLAVASGGAPSPGAGMYTAYTDTDWSNGGAGQINWSSIVSYYLLSVGGAIWYSPDGGLTNTYVPFTGGATGTYSVVYTNFQYTVYATNNLPDPAYILTTNTPFGVLYTAVTNVGGALGASNYVSTAGRQATVHFNTNTLAGVNTLYGTTNLAFLSNSTVYVTYSTNVMGAVTTQYGATNLAFLSNNTTYVRFNTNVIGGVTTQYGATNLAFLSNNTTFVTFNTNVIGSAATLYGSTNLAFLSNNTTFVTFNTNDLFSPTGGIPVSGTANTVAVSNRIVYVGIDTNQQAGNWAQYPAQTNVNLNGYTLYGVGGLSFTGDLAIGFSIFSDTNTVPAPTDANVWTLFAAKVNGTNYLMGVDSQTNRTYIGNHP